MTQPAGARGQLLYRADIQGLRAIAVLAVVLFHAGVPGLPGGFVGVDIFFVISGYLITGMIVRQVEAGTFRFRDFYLRRFRRLFPALLVTVAASYVAGYLLLGPEHFRNLSISSIATLLSGSNILFWLEAGYFDPGAILKPLLHTWSLSVEEQFYLFWPALLIGAGLLNRKLLPAAIVLVGAAGLALQAWAIRAEPVAAFYLIPFRLHEFAFGAVLVWAERWKPQSPLALTAIYGAGLGLIGWSIIGLSELTPFPGVASIIPCLGTALAIYAGTTPGLPSVLSIRPIVFIGTISYSLYLVHWPLIVFTHYVFVSLSPLAIVAVLTATLILGTSLYFFVERGFRFPGAGFRLSARRVLLGASVATLLLAGTAAASYQQGGWIWRLPEAVQKANAAQPLEYAEQIWAAFTKNRLDAYHGNGKPKVLIVGDSQSADIVNMLVRNNGSRRFDIVTFGVQGCGVLYIPPERADHYWTRENIWTIHDPGRIDACKIWLANFFASPLLAEADYVLISVLWGSYMAPYLPETIRRLEKLTPGRVLIMGRKDLQLSSISILNRFGQTEGVERFAVNFRNRESEAINRRLHKAVGDNFFDLYSLVCPGWKRCAVITSADEGVFLDPVHLSQGGAKLLGSRLLKSGLLSGK